MALSYRKATAHSPTRSEMDEDTVMPTAATPATPAENEQTEINQEQPPDDRLNVIVRNNQGLDITFKIKRTTLMSKVTESYCQRVGKAPRSLRFLFDGERLTATHTPESLGMEDGDAIDAFEEQIGGSAELITIIVRDAHGYELAFKLRPTTALGKVMDAFCQKHNHFAGNPPRRTVRFMTEGTRVQDKDTPESLSLEDGDIIEVFVEALGGL